jgi:hypothetical protein
MSTKIINIKTSIITISYILFSIGAMAQAHSSGGGSETGYKSTLGNQNTASGNYSLAAGWGNQAIGQTSFALGYYSKAEGLNSMALGMYSCSQNAYGITIGRGLSSTKPLSNTTNGIMLGMYSNVPTLYITTSSGENRTGKIGIGNITSPSAKLHIKSDSSGENENADIMLETSASSQYAAIYFKTTDNYIRMRNTAGLEFNAPRFNFQTGKVGIGNVTSPSAKLHIKADNGERADLMLEATGTSAIYFKNTNNSISLTGNIMTLSASGFSYTNGNVAIGTMPNNDYKLAVKGVIRSEEVVVELMTSWPDYVFASDYSLPKLKEVKAFVNENGHLPGLPNASQVSEEGLGLGDINAKLLEKIEELTLYIIEQEERIQKLEEKLNACH